MADSKLDPNKSYGWTGKILRVNLTDKTVSVSPTDPYKEYLGGMGIANKIMYDEVPAGTDPLSPENKIVFAVGPLTATGVPLAGRTTIASLSTYTTDHQVVDAHTGGMIGAAIKKAGWDAIVIEGASDEPVYLKSVGPGHPRHHRGALAQGGHRLLRGHHRPCRREPAALRLHHQFPQPFRRRWSRRRHGLEEIEGARRAR